jgi:hypothetical protein
LASTPEGLFPAESNRLEDQNNYARVVGGWYVDANLNHRDKFAVLLQLNYLAGLTYEVDWSFKIEGGTEELAELQSAVARAEEMLAELLAS